MIKQQAEDNLYQNESLRNFAELISNINLLKNKKYGCPWQNMQTHETLTVSYTHLTLPTSHLV